MPRANWFLALVVPEQAGLSQLLRDLPPGQRPFQAVDLHITVAFLGACDRTQAWQAWRAIAPLQHPAIAVAAAAWRAMGPPEHPSAYALTLGPDPLQDQGQSSRLTATLIERWREPALAAAGLPSQRRPALPHITLARPRRRGMEQDRTAMASWLQQAPLPQQRFILGEIGLYTWASDRQQQLFRLEARRPLDAGQSRG